MYGLEEAEVQSSFGALELLSRMSLFLYLDIQGARSFINFILKSKFVLNNVC